MNAKDVLQSLKANLERESQFDDSNIQVKIHASGEMVIVSVPVDGKLKLIEVFARDLGVREGISVKDI